MSPRTEPHSLWHHESKPRHLIDSHITFQADADVVVEYGVFAAYIAAKMYVLRSMELIRLAEKERTHVQRQLEQSNQEMSKTEEMKKELRENIKERNTFSQLYQQLKKSHADLKLELQKSINSAKSAEEARWSLNLKRLRAPSPPWKIIWSFKSLPSRKKLKLANLKLLISMKTGSTPLWIKSISLPLQLTSRRGMFGRKL